MKRYRQAFDALRLPPDMAERIRAAAETQPRRSFPFRQVLALSGCAAAACLGLVILQQPASRDIVQPPEIQVSQPASGQQETPSSSENAYGGDGETEDAAAETETTPDTPQTSETPSPSRPEEPAAQTRQEKNAGQLPPAETDVSQTAPSDSANQADPPELSLSDGALGSAGGGSSCAAPVSASSPEELLSLLAFSPVLPQTVPQGWETVSCTAADDGSWGEILYADSAGQASLALEPAQENETEQDWQAEEQDALVLSLSRCAGGICYTISFSPAVSPQTAAAWTELWP